MEVAVIGGGAAGFFSAISCKSHHPGARVTIYEKSDKLLAKVKVSGGGRCNVTHACFSIPELAKQYPRGEKHLKKSFTLFGVQDTINWFESRGVKLKTEEDSRMFPVSDDSQTIIDCLVKEAQKLGVNIQSHQQILSIHKEEKGFKLVLKEKVVYPEKVIVASGGAPKLSGFDWLKNLGHHIEPPVPSLFTFNMPNEPIRELMGIVADPVSIHVQGNKLKQTGPLLVTHWGMSGPAVLKLSAWGAKELNKMNYWFKVQVNWVGENENTVREKLLQGFEEMKKRKVANKNPFQLPQRLWSFLLKKSEINEGVSWIDLNKTKVNKLVNTLLNDEYQVEGKTTFKEEFVTCGGVSLMDVEMDTIESKVCRGLYFAGEVLDIDGVTGGFNFQAAWTTGFIAGRLLSH